MAEQFSTQIPTIAGSKAQVSPDRTMAALSNLAGSLSTYGQITAKKLQEVQTAKAESDFVAKTINDDDFEVSSAYSRTVRSMENEDWFMGINNGIEEALDNPDHQFSKMDEAAFSKYLQEAAGSRTQQFQKDQFSEYHSMDFANFLTQNRVKLMANHAKVRKARNHEKLITGTTEAVTRYFKEPGRSQEDVQKYLAALPGTAQLDSKTWANIAATAATAAAASGSDVGVKYVEEQLLNSHPELQGSLNTAKQQYYKKLDEEEKTRIFDGISSMEQRAAAGLLTDTDFVAAMEDGGVYRQLGISGLLSLKRRNAENSFKQGNVLDLVRKIREGQEVTASSSEDINKALDLVWQEDLAKNPTPTAAMVEHFKTAARFGELGKQAKGWASRAVAVPENLSEGTPAPDSWFAIMGLFEEAKAGNAQELFGFDERTMLGLGVAYTAFDLATSKEQNPEQNVMAAASEAYKQYHLFMTKAAKGTLPVALQNRREFDTRVDAALDDVANAPWYGSLVGSVPVAGPLMADMLGLRGKDSAVSAEMRQSLKDVTYNLGLTTAHTDVKDLVEAAIPVMKGRYGDFGGTVYKAGALPLHNVLHVNKGDLPAVADFMKKQAIAAKFPDVDAADLTVEGVAVGNDYMFFLKPKDSMDTVKVLASELGEQYNIDTANKRTVEEADAAKTAETKRLIAKQRDNAIGSEFAASMSLYGKRNNLSPEFRQLFYSSSKDTRNLIAKAFINAERMGWDTPTTEAVQAAKAKARSEQIVNKIKEIAGGVLESNDALTTEILGANIFGLMQLSPEEQPAINDLTIAEAKEYARVLDRMPEIGIMPYLAQSAHTKALLFVNQLQEDMLRGDMQKEIEMPKEILKAIPQSYTPYVQALSVVMTEEGGYNPDDVGAEAFMGINRKFNPDWAGWKVIDSITDDIYPTEQDKITAVDELMKDPDIRLSVARLYKEKYYDPLAMEDIADTGIKSIMLDHSINAGSSWPAYHARQALEDIGKLSGDVYKQTALTAAEVKAINENLGAFKPAFVKRVSEHKYYNEGHKKRKQRVASGQYLTDVEPHITAFSAAYMENEDAGLTESGAE